MLYITLTHIVKGIIEFYLGVYHTHTHIKGIIEFYHGVYHTHTHPKGYNIVISWCISHSHTS
jgi:hypothetical protein